MFVFATEGRLIGASPGYYAQMVEQIAATSSGLVDGARGYGDHIRVGGVEHLVTRCGEGALVLLPVNEVIWAGCVTERAVGWTTRSPGCRSTPPSRRREPARPERGTPWAPRAATRGRAGSGSDRAGEQSPTLPTLPQPSTRSSDRSPAQSVWNTPSRSARR
ncbi:hypothetical protein GCM10009551_019200 [Nocardiopsis tropica]